MADSIVQRENLLLMSVMKEYRQEKSIEIKDIKQMIEDIKWHGLEAYLLDNIFDNPVYAEKKELLADLKHKRDNWQLILKYKLSEMQRIVTLLENKGIEFAIIKGFGTIYWMKSRYILSKVFSDYDILVREDCLEKAEDILLNYGYRRDESTEKNLMRKHLVWHVSPLIKEPFCSVELHHRFTQIYDKHNFDVRKALDNTVTATVGGVTFPTLDIESSIFLLALHLYQHEYKDITFQLRHHAEIVNIILCNKDLIKWDKLVSMIIVNKAQFPITYSFYHINLIYRKVLGNDCIPAEVIKEIEPENFMEEKDMLSHRHIYEEPPFGNWDFQTAHWKYKYGKDWKGGYEERLFGDMKDVTLRFYYLFFRHYIEDNWKRECREMGIEYKPELFF